MGSKLIIRQWGQREDRPHLRFFRREYNDPWFRVGRTGRWIYIHLHFLGIAYRKPR